MVTMMMQQDGERERERVQAGLQPVVQAFVSLLLHLVCWCPCLEMCFRTYFYGLWLMCLIIIIIINHCDLQDSDTPFNLSIFEARANNRC